MIFEIWSCCLLFTLHQLPLWNLRLDSWSPAKTKQNGIFVCEFWCLFDNLNFWRMMVLMVFMLLRLCVLVGKKKLTSSPQPWTPQFSSFMLLLFDTPHFRSASPCLFYFFTFFYYFSFLAFIYFIVIFFILSISRNMQHCLMQIFLFFLFSLF